MISRLLVLALLACFTVGGKDLLLVTTNWSLRHDEVLLVDPETDHVKTIWSGRGAQLDIGLSPDGSQVFVSGSDGLDVVNTASGLITRQPQVSQIVRWIMPSKPSLAGSSDGRWMYFFNTKFRSGAGGHDYALTAFDTRDGRFAEIEAYLPDCQGALLWPLKDGSVVVRCGNKLQFFRLYTEGFAETGPPVDLPKLTRVMGRHDMEDAFRDGQLDPAQKVLYFISGAGRLVSVDLETHDTTVGAKEPLIADSGFGQSSATITPDGRVWYVPARSRADSSGPTQIAAIDLQTSQLGHVITVSEPFWSLTMSSDGKTLYAGAADHDRILVIDAVTGREIRKISIPGRPSILTCASAN